LWAKRLNAKDIHKEMFPVYGGKCFSHKAVHNWVKKFSQGHSKVTDDSQPSRPVEIATEATMQRVKELFQADRRITTDSVATALGHSHGLAYNIIYDNLKSQKVCTWWLSTKLKHREKVKRTEWVCPCNISYSMQMNKILVCLTRLLLGTNHGCFTTNMNQSVLQCNGNIPVHLQPKSSKFKVTPSAGKVMLTNALEFSGSTVSPFSEVW
jgi:transposase